MLKYQVIDSYSEDADSSLNRARSWIILVISVTISIIFLSDRYSWVIRSFSTKGTYSSQNISSNHCHVTTTAMYVNNQ